MAIKTMTDLPVDLDEVTKPKKAGIPIVEVCTDRAELGFLPSKPENLVAEYNLIQDKLKSLEARQEVIANLLTRQGFTFLCEHNCSASEKNRLASVRLKDQVLPDDKPKSDAETEIVMVTAAESYLKFDKAQAEAALRLMRRGDSKFDVNTCLKWDVAAKFDAKVFYDANGKFSKARCEDFIKALEKVAVLYKIENPLSLGKVPAVQDDFHQRRWTDFSASENVKLQEVLPLKISLRSQRPTIKTS